MANSDFLVKYKLDINSLNSKQIGNVKLEDLQEMVMPEFINFQGRIVNMVKFRRYDTALYKNSVAITPAHTKAMFRAGEGENDTWANDLTDTYVKTRVHTNMMAKGEWQPGEVAIIHEIECIVRGLNAGKPTTTADGIISDPAIAAFPVNVDVFLLTDVATDQFNLSFQRGGNRQTIVEGTVGDFPQLSGKSGSGGSSATFTSGFSQNMGYNDRALLNKPQVIEGKDDFQFLLEPLAPSLSLVAAARDLTFKVQISTWEFLRYYA